MIYEAEVRESAQLWEVLAENKNARIKRLWDLLDRIDEYVTEYGTMPLSLELREEVKETLEATK